MDILWQDLRHAIGTLRRQPAFTAVIIITLAVGLGANTAVFTLVHSTLLAPLPYHQADRLAILWTGIPAQNVNEATSSYANIQDWKAQNRAFQDLATFDPTTLTVTDGEWPEQVSAARASANLFDVLGVSPALGRTFSADEERRSVPVVMLGHDYARRRFGEARTAIGRTIEIAGTSVQVVGVMSADFRFPDRSTELWLPQTLFTEWATVSTRRGTHSWRVIARLRDGTSIEQARTDMRTIAGRLEQEYPADNAGLGINVVPLAEQVTGRPFRVALWLLFSAVTVVLLIACANAAHLILARGMDRAKEFALRQAVGATTPRLIRQAVTENVLISLAAGAAGLLLAHTGLQMLIALAPANLPRLDDVGIDARVLLYAVGVSLVAGVLIGLLPALTSSRADLSARLREGQESARHGRGQRVRGMLIVLQFALAVVLVFCANLLVRSLSEARNVDAGFATENVLLANLSVEQSSRRVPFYVQMLEEVQSMPGVRAAGIVEDLFISGAPNRAIAIEGRSVEGRVAETVGLEQIRIDAIAGDFFSAVGVPVREGRAFTPADAADAVPVAIINETLARRYWPGESALGRRFRTGDAGTPWIEIVGVVSDMRRQGHERVPIAQVFRPFVQEPSRNMNLLVATDLPAATLAPALRSAIAAIDRSVPLYHVTTVSDALDRYLVQRRFETFLLGLFSTIALVLAALGIHGVMQYSVTRRTHELSVRAALGASSGSLVMMVVRQGLTLAVPGIAAGIVGAVWLADTLSALLFGISASDPANLLIPASTLLGVALIASWLPARRAARADPMSVMRMH